MFTFIGWVVVTAMIIMLAGFGALYAKFLLDMRCSSDNIFDYDETEL